MENQKINAYRVSLSDIVGVYENLSGIVEPSKSVYVVVLFREGTWVQGSSSQEQETVTQESFNSPSRKRQKIQKLSFNTYFYLHSRLSGVRSLSLADWFWRPSVSLTI